MNATQKATLNELATRISHNLSEINTEPSALERLASAENHLRSIREELWRMAETVEKEAPEPKEIPLPAEGSALTLWVRAYAETLEMLKGVETYLKQKEQDFKRENYPLYTQKATLEAACKTQRLTISRMILQDFEESGERPVPPLGLQVRVVPEILKADAIVTWAIENNKPALLKLDETQVKQYIIEHQHIVDGDGVALGHMTNQNVAVMGETTLLGWLNERRYEESHKDEVEIR